jgi:glycosyltransferase 2 family protein
MMDTPRIQSADGKTWAQRARLAMPSSRHRHPGDVLRMIVAAVIFAIAGSTAVLAPRTLLNPGEFTVTGVALNTTAGRVLTGLTQVVIAGAALVLLVAGLERRRWRVLATVGSSFVGAAAVLTAIMYLAGQGAFGALTLGLRQDSWLTGGGFPEPFIIAGLVAVAVAVAPWFSRAGRRIGWALLLLIAVGRLVTGGLSPLEFVMALTAGVSVGAGMLVVFGVPDRRIAAPGVAAALLAGGIPATQVVEIGAAKGSRPFRVRTEDDQALFVKVVSSEQRDADLLYRAYRAIRLRGVGDTRPAASLAGAVEHEALIAVMAERAGVAVPHVGHIIKADDGSVLLTMELITGQPLDEIPADNITDELAHDVWREVARLHTAKIAHRSLHAGNIVIDEDGRPWLTDFSFAELAATGRQMALDTSELIASLAGRIGPHRAVNSATYVIGRDSVAAAVPLLQPLALSASTRRSMKGQDGTLQRTREAAIQASSIEADTDLAKLQRVRPRTLLSITALVGAFYILLPRIAQVSNGWHAILHADWTWLPVVILLSGLTYVGSALALIGSVPGHIPFRPALLAQGASSFINRVSPANVGGMALNARFLQKTGTDAPTSVAAVGVNSLAGAVVHALLMIVFFTLAGQDLTRAFKLPSGSKFLLILAVVLAATGIILATRLGRRWARKQLLPALRAAAASLKRAAASPIKMGLLFGGSALVTLAYMGALMISIKAFSPGPRLVLVGAVYLGAAALAAAAPTPGGLGAIEAALVAGLTGVGMHAGPAVSAVLLYRLATYWLPVLPGWLSWRFLQRRGYL